MYYIICLDKKFARLGCWLDLEIVRELGRVYEKKSLIQLQGSPHNYRFFYWEIFTHVFTMLAGPLYAIAID